MASEAAFSSSQAPNGLKLRADQHVGRPSGASVAAFYELQRIADAVLLHGARHVALQFPEAFLADAADVVWQLEGIFEAAGKAPYDDGAGGVNGGNGDSGGSYGGAVDEMPLLFVLFQLVDEGHTWTHWTRPSNPSRP